MKARINYSLNIDEIPNKICDLMREIEAAVIVLGDKANDGVQNACMKTDNVIKYELLKLVINDLRIALSGVDQSLSDVDSILNGYIQLISDETPLPKGPEENANEG